MAWGLPPAKPAECPIGSLEAAGIESKQAEAIVGAIRSSGEASVTKADLTASTTALRGEMKARATELRGEMAGHARSACG